MFDDLGKAEVDDFDAAVVAPQDVGRLEVTVQHAAGMRVRQTSAGLDERLHNLPPRRTGLQPMPQVLAGHVFHRDVQRRGVVVVHADAEHLDDILVGEACECLGFGDERSWSVRRMSAQQLECDAAAQRRILGHVDGAHSPRADPVSQLETTQADWGCGLCAQQLLLETTFEDGQAPRRTCRCPRVERSAEAAVSRIPRPPVVGPRHRRCVANPEPRSPCASS